MAITAAIVNASKNHLRYLITATAGAGEAVSIESDGGVTPDLVTDSSGNSGGVGPTGSINRVVNVKRDGYGKIAVGGISTQAQARALLQSDDAAVQVGPNVPTLMCRLSPRTTAAGGFTVDAVRGPSDLTTPGLTITAFAIGTVYLDIYLPGAIG